MKRINAYIDETLWHRFRLACLARKISASKVLVDLIQQQLKKWSTEEA